MLNLRIMSKNYNEKYNSIAIKSLQGLKWWLKQYINDAYQLLQNIKGLWESLLEQFK